jgi:predicted AlkP superfamily pyrophosphatase or phosphodiesterase
METKYSELKNFMDSYEDNDQLGEYIRELLQDDSLSVVVEYHGVSDGKHALIINEEAVTSINAWNTPEQVKRSIEEIMEELKTTVNRTRLKEILDYLMESEENHYEESEKPKNHIYAKAKKIYDEMEG